MAVDAAHLGRPMPTVISLACGRTRCPSRIDSESATASYVARPSNEASSYAFANARATPSRSIMPACDRDVLTLEHPNVRTES